MLVYTNTAINNRPSASSTSVDSALSVLSVDKEQATKAKKTPAKHSKHSYLEGQGSPATYWRNETINRATLVAFPGRSRLIRSVGRW